MVIEELPLLSKAILSAETHQTDLPLSCVPIIRADLTAGIQMSSVFRVISSTAVHWVISTCGMCQCVIRG